MAKAEPKPLNVVFETLPTTIFEVMTRLSIEHNSVNLGQGESEPSVTARKAPFLWPLPAHMMAPHCRCLYMACQQGTLVLER